MISVIIPVFNREEYIADAIESVLAQNYNDLEVIVIDDGSTDNTKTEILKFGNKVNYFYRENAGVPQALNFGVNIAKGDIISFIDSDDLWPLNRLNILLNNYNESTDVIMGHVADFIDDENRKPVVIRNEVFAYSLGAAIFKKKAFDRAGMFDGEMLFCHDIDWFMKAKKNKLNIKIIRDEVLLVRKHNNNMTKDQELLKKYLLKSLVNNIKDKTVNES